MALPFAQRSFVLVGFAPKARNQLENEIKSLGGNVNFAVSKNTSYVVVPSDSAAKNVRIGSTAVTKVVREEFVARCAVARALLDDSEFIIDLKTLKEIETRAESSTGSSDWLRIDSLEEARLAEEHEKEVQKRREAEELIQKEKEARRLKALEPPPIKRVVMGRDGQVKYIYKDNKQVVIKPTYSDHLLGDLTTKAQEQRSELDAAAQEARRAKLAQRRREKKKRRQEKELVELESDRALEESGGGIFSHESETSAWIFSLGGSSRALNVVLGIDGSSANQGVVGGGPGPFCIRSTAIHSVKQISCGSHHSAILDSRGSVFTWGMGLKGRLGLGHSRNVHAPARVSLPGRVARVSCGHTHTCAVMENGDLYLWGAMAQFFHSDSPVKIALDDVGGAVKDPANAVVRCGVDTVGLIHGPSGALFIWGDNSHGQVGIGANKKFITTPTFVTSSVKDIAFGTDHVLALKTDGKVFAWGNGAGGACGDGSYDKHPRPSSSALAFSSNNSQIVHMHCGNQRSVCVDSTGAVFIFGRGESGTPDLPFPAKLSIPTICTTPKSAFLAHHGLSTDIIIVDSKGVMVSFQWSSCQFDAQSRTCISGPNTLGKDVHLVLPIAIPERESEVTVGAQHGIIRVASPHAQALFCATEGFCHKMADTMVNASHANQLSILEYSDGLRSTLLHAAANCHHGAPERAANLVHYVLNLATSLGTRHLTQIVNAKNSAGRTALHLAAMKSQEAVVKQLIATHACDVNARDADGNTPLHLSVRAYAEAGENTTNRANAQRVQKALIIDGVCDFDIMNASGLNVVDFALLELGEVDLAYALNQQGAPVNIVHLKRLGLHWWLSILGSSDSSSSLSSNSGSSVATTSSENSAWIAHANQDYDLAHRLQRALIRSGVRASCDLWKFSSDMHSRVRVVVLLLTDASLSDDRCLIEVYNAVALHGGVCHAILCEDLSKPIPEMLRKLIKRQIIAVPQTRSTARRVVAQINEQAEENDFDESHSFSDSAKSVPESDHLSGDPNPVAREASTATTATSTKLQAFPQDLISTISQNLSQILEQITNGSAGGSSKRNLNFSPSDLLRDCGFTVENLEKSVALHPRQRLLASSSAERSVRVFVSSTFRDMHFEREQLVKHIFPQLERFCLDRHISFSFVDLRWGITEEMSSTGQVLVTCLKEVERSYPYFLSMLGERYGWHDMSDVTSVRDELLDLTFDKAIDAGFTWVDRFRDKSITEIEIIQGALRFVPAERFLGEPVDYGYDASPEERDKKLQSLNAFFYLREPSFIDSIPAKKKEIYSAENFHAKHKCYELRERIRSGGLDWKGYRDMESFQTLVLDDFKKAIDRQFANEREPTATELENLRHIAFAKPHLSIHVPRWRYLNAIHQHVNSSSRIESPLIVLAKRGIGATALMAYASAYYKSLNPARLVVMHFMRASDKSTIYYEVIRRIITEIHDHFQIQQPVPTEKEEVISDFGGWLQLADERGGMLIFIDGLNHLDNTDGSNDLSWFPERIPNNVRVVLSHTTQFDIYNTDNWANSQWTKKSSWTQAIQLGPLEDDEKSAIINQVLAERSKTLSQRQREKLISNGPCANPLFLKTILDELTVEGTFETLDQYIDGYLQTGSIERLYQAILARWYRDYGTSFVQDALQLILAARQGISEYELLDILQCSHADWSRLYVSLKDSLVDRAGLLSFSNSVLQTVVEEIGHVKRARTQIAEYFQRQLDDKTTQTVSDRVAAELPYQLKLLQDFPALQSCLADIRMFSALYTDLYEFELVEYWRLVETAFNNNPKSFSLELREKIAQSNTNGSTDIVLVTLNTALEAFESSSSSSASSIRDIANRCYNMGEFCREIAKYPASERFYLRAQDLQEKLVAAASASAAVRAAALGDLNVEGQSIFEELALTFDGLSFLYKTIYKYHDAAGFSKKAIATLEPLPMSRSLVYTWVSVLCNYSQLLGRQVKLDESMTVGERAVRIARAGLPPYDPEVARALNVLSVAYKKLKMFDAAEPLAMESLRLREKVCGPNHTFVSYSLMNVGNINAKLKRFNEAVSAYERMYRITRDCHGEEHPLAAQARYSLGKLYVKFGYKKLATENLNAALEISLRIYGNDHALTKKIYMKILDMLGYNESEAELRESIFENIRRVVRFGLNQKVLLRNSDGWIVPARVETKKAEAAALGYIYHEPERPKIEIYPAGYFERMKALEEARRAAAAAAAAPPAPPEPFESSDEEACCEEDLFESSDEDMGFSLFD